MWVRGFLRHLLTLLLTVFFGGFLGATLVRFAPGFDVDERELDPRLQEGSIRALRRDRASEHNIIGFYGRYLFGLSRGNLGVSRSLGRPVAQLFAERIPVTARMAGLGLMGAWLLGFGSALIGVTARKWALDLFTTFVSGLFLCLPSAVLALLFLYWRGPVPVAIAAVVAPRIFRYCQNLLMQTYESPHVLTARAKGLHPARILIWHVLPPAAPQILALAGVSVSMALGAAVPIEAICDSPGIGQLAWQAALGRDLPLLVNLTLFVALVTLTVNSVSDLACKAWERHPA